MTFPQTVLLAAFAGGTIFLGLPVGRLRRLSRGWQAALTTSAGGVILFLIYDVLSQAVERSAAPLSRRAAATHRPVRRLRDGSRAERGIRLLSVTYVTSKMAGRREQGMPISKRQIALGTAVGLGLHNFSEGLAIGQSSATGATTFAFCWSWDSRSTTPRKASPSPRRSAATIGRVGASWPRGLVGGGPTFVGGVLGYAVVSPVLSILFLGLAAGALIFVFNEMMAVARRFSLPMVTGVALTIGLLVAFGTTSCYRPRGRRPRQTAGAPRVAGSDRDDRVDRIVGEDLGRPGRARSPNPIDVLEPHAAEARDGQDRVADRDRHPLGQRQFLCGGMIVEAGGSSKRSPIPWPIP